MVAAKCNCNDNTETLLLDQNKEINATSISSFISADEYNRIMSHKLCIEHDPANNEHTFAEGYRIVELQFLLQNVIHFQCKHSQKRTTGELKLLDEDRKGFGLVSNLIFKYNMCGFQTSTKTESPNSTQMNYSKLNASAVWATLATGNTFTNFKEQLSIMNIPSMPYNMFHNIENMLGDVWHDALWKSIEEAGEEEFKIGLQKNQIDKDGVVWITIHVDGWWSHRSYGHNYNAASDVLRLIINSDKQILNKRSVDIFN